MSRAALADQNGSGLYKFAAKTLHAQALPGRVAADLLKIRRLSYVAMMDSFVGPLRAGRAKTLGRSDFADFEQLYSSADGRDESCIGRRS